MNAQLILEKIFSNSEVVSYSELSGMRHVNIEVYLRDREPVIVRFMDPNKESSFFNRIGYYQQGLSVETEAQIMRILEPVLGDLVPNVLDEGEIEEGKYLVVSRLSGDPLRDYREDTSIEDGEKVMFSLGQLVGLLHKELSFTDFGAFSEKGFENWAKFWEYVTRLKTDENDPLFGSAYSQVFEEEERAEISDYISRMSDKRFGVTPTMVIYDLHDGNVLVCDDFRVSGIFDFDHAHRGIESRTDRASYPWE